jgi:hypothetical protein
MRCTGSQGGWSEAWCDSSRGDTGRTIVAEAQARLCKTDRYVILKGKCPVFTTANVQALIPWLWGRDLRDHYTVLDYEKAYPVDKPDLCAWMQQLEEFADE